ncbi:hypothetical protein [Gordonia spumicola]|uniref:hypothetical protein n=1 Tax=Gordonia spumicola TaxID=589161 RepID=UPI00137A05B5|nr:hypothetical protein [Gordonia spumicola]
MWTDIMETLARIDSMDPGAASADAAEIARIAARAQAVADRLRTAFAPGGQLAGWAAEGSSDAGQALASRIGIAAGGLAPAAGALGRAAAVLTASHAVRPRIASLAPMAHTGDPALVSTLVATINLAMVGTYNHPMAIDVQASSAGDGGTNAGGPVSAATGSNGAGDLTRTTADPSTANRAGDTPVGLAPQNTRTPETPKPSATTTPAAASTTTPAAVARTPSTGTSPTVTPAGRTGSGPSGPAAPASRGTPSTLRPAGIAPVGTSTGRGTLGSTTASTLGSPRAGSPSPSTVRPFTTPLGASPTVGTTASTAQRGATGGTPVGAGATKSRDEKSRGPSPYLRSRSEGELLLGEQPLVTPAVLALPVDPIVDDDAGEPEREE